MTALDKFLEMIDGRRIFCSQKIKEDGNLVGIYGKVVFHDENHIVLQSDKSIHLININHILELEYTPELEIVSTEDV